MAQYRIEDKSLTKLQYNIIRSHSTGAGKPLPPLYVKAAMIARLFTFLQGKSGIHTELVELLVKFINLDIFPYIPEHGSVGASGDLVQLAHIALTLIGEGEVFYQGQLQPTVQVLEKNHLKPFSIHIREGLSVTNFHGDYVSFEMDKLKIAISKLTMLSERQLNYLFHDRINGILPPFVNLGVLGLNYGLQASQFTATSTTAECQTLSNPMYIHSIPNNNDNQDIVSMGTNSALIAKTVIENSFQVMSILFMGIVQAVDYLKIQEKLSTESRCVYNEIRAFFPVFTQDTPKYKEIEAMSEYLKNKKFNL